MRKATIHAPDTLDGYYWGIHILKQKAEIDLDKVDPNVLEVIRTATHWKIVDSDGQQIDQGELAEQQPERDLVGQVQAALAEIEAISDEYLPLTTEQRTAVANIADSLTALIQRSDELLQQPEEPESPPEKPKRGRKPKAETQAVIFEGDQQPEEPESQDDTDTEEEEQPQ